MKYNLIVETTPGTWERLDFGEDAPALVFQANDINQLQDRNASYSQALKLPMTANNRKVFGYVDVFQAKSRAPYIVLPCRLFEDGAVIIGSGYRLELRKVTDSYECQIVSDIQDLFSILKELDMTSVLPVINWTIEDIQASIAGQRNLYEYIRNVNIEPYNNATASQRVANGRYYVQGWTGDYDQLWSYPVYGLWPYIPLLKLVRNILDAQGYTLDTDIESIPGYREHFVSIADLISSEPGYTAITATMRSNRAIRASDGVAVTATGWTGTDTNNTTMYTIRPGAKHYYTGENNDILYAGVAYYTQNFTFISSEATEQGQHNRTRLNPPPNAIYMAACSYGSAPIIEYISDDAYEPLQGHVISVQAQPSTTQRIYLLGSIQENAFQFDEVRPLILMDPDTEELPHEVNYGISYSAVGMMKPKLKFVFSNSSGSVTPDGTRFMVRVRRYSQALNSTTYQEVIIDEGRQTDDADDTSIISLGEWISDSIELFPGERIFIEANLLSGTAGISYRARVDFILEAEENQALPACKLDLGHSMGFKNQEEVIKTFIQLYGLSIDVNRETATVRAYTFNRLDTMIEAGNYLDWTDKVDMASVVDKTFRLSSYAQVNRILFQQNSTYNFIGVDKTIPFQDIGQITINDATIAATKDLFTIPVESAQDIPRTYYPFSTNVQGGPMTIDLRYLRTDNPERVYFDTAYGRQTTGSSFPAVEYKAGKTRVVYAENPYPFTAYGSYVVPSVSYPITTRQARTENVQYFIDTYYGTLRRILDGIRILEIELNLTAIDIQKLDLFTPIYLEQYREFFYIQKVSNYVSGSLTKVTLICLNTI